MSKHTPGPWYIPDFDKTRVDNNYRIVAHVTPSSAYRHENESNARLIAAAPDLLHIAKLILEEWERPTEGVLPGELIARLSQYAKEAREAVNKAEGK